MKPNFIGIGAQKCASTWLYEILADHPEVLLSSRKELDFFSYRYELGYGWYAGQFADKPDVNAVGEISPSYLNESSVPERVKMYSPDMRILLSLRDPVERALSQHRHLVRIGYVRGPDYSFESALADNPSYVEQGRYAEHLGRWLSSFPSNQIHVVLMEDIKKDPEEVARGVYAFLGIATQHRSAALHGRSNPSYVSRHRGLATAVDTLRGIAHRTGLGPAWRGIGRLGAQHLYRRLNRKPSEAVIPAPRPDTLRQLRETFREDVLALEGLLGRSLRAWL